MLRRSFREWQGEHTTLVQELVLSARQALSPLLILVNNRRSFQSGFGYKNLYDQSYIAGDNPDVCSITRHCVTVLGRPMLRKGCTG